MKRQKLSNAKNPDLNASLAAIQTGTEIIITKKWQACAHHSGSIAQEAA